MSRWTSVAGGLALAAGLALAQPASAAIIFGTGNPGNQGTDNVIFNACSGASQTPGMTVQGCLNGQPTTLVNFTSNETLVVNGGQARIEAQDGALSELSIGFAAPGSTFGKLILNIDVAQNQTGTVTFTVAPQGVSSPAFNLGNGANFFFVEGTNGEQFSLFSFVTTATVLGIQIVDDVQQVRLGGGNTPVGVPEPASLALLGAGLLGLSALRRRRTA